MAVKDGLPSTDFSRMNREYIKAVAEGSAGSVLPEIAAADEGKFLGVVSGEAAWATAGGGAEKFVITYEYGEGDAVVADKTYAEILSAYTTGKEISAVLFDSPSYTYLYLEMVLANETNGVFKFRDIPSMATDNSDTPTKIYISQEEIDHGVTDSVESITEYYTNVTIPLS